jgi:hypothetical protein
MALNNLSATVNWDMNSKHVQPSIQDNGVAVQASSILIAIGAPTLKASGTRPSLSQGVYNSAFGDSLDFAYACGLIENVSVGQNKQLQQFFEIGSKLRYFIPGRTINSLNVSRAYLDGPSLLKVLYAFYKNPDDLNEGGFELPKNPNTGYINNIDRNDQPGYNSIWMNVASQLFDFPIGMLLYFRDNRGEDKGAIYLENCFISSHNFGINSSSTLFSESVSMQFDRIRPVNLTVG